MFLIVTASHTRERISLHCNNTRWQTAPRNFISAAKLEFDLAYHIHCSSNNCNNYFSSKSLMLGKIEGRRRRGWQRMRWFDGFTDSMDMNLNKLWEMVKDREAWHVATCGVTKSQIWLSDWTTNFPYGASQVVLVVKNSHANAGDKQNMDLSVL